MLRSYDLSSVFRQLRIGEFDLHTRFLLQEEEMATITRFQYLQCWMAVRQLVNIVMEACNEGKLSKDWGMRSQIARAAISTMNNIAEGGGREGQKDSIRFYHIAQSSSGEVKSMTYVFEDSSYLPKRILQIRAKSEETKALTLA